MTVATIAGAGVGPQFGEPVTLHVSSQGGVVRAYEDGVLVIEYTLPADHPHTGGVGLFIRGTSLAEFEELSITPL